MGKNKLVRNIVLGALVLLVVGAIGYAADNSGSSHDTAAVGTGDVFAAGDSTGADGGSVAVGPGNVAGSLGKAPRPDAINGAPPALSEASQSTRNGAGKDASSVGSGSVGATGSGTGTDALASTADRKLVQTASMQLQVKEVGASFEEVGRIASSVGGFIASSSFSYKGEAQIASVTIRVPETSYQSVLSSLRGLGVKVDAEDSDSNDVTDEYTDLSSRQRNLEATETQLLTLLQKAETITDILTVQDRLNDVRSQIEQIKGRMQLLDNLTDLATITVHLRPEVGAVASVNGDGGVDLGAKVSEAWDNSLDFLGGIAGGVITVIVFSWWIPLAGAPLALLFWLFTRNRPNGVHAVD